MKEQNVNLLNTKTNLYLKQSQKLLINSLIFAGIGFILVCGLSLLYSFIVNKFCYSMLNSDGYFFSSLIVLFVFLILIIYLNYKWSFNVVGASWAIISLCWIANIFLFTGMIAPLVTLINNFNLVYAMVGVTGVIFLLSAVIGYLLITTKIAISLMKLLMIITSALFFLGIIFIFPFSFLYSNAFSIAYLIYDICFLVIALIITVLTFWQMQKTNYFYEQLDKQSKLKVSLFYGLRLLTCFVYLLYYLLLAITRFTGRK